MSTNHGGEIKQKSIGQIALFIKKQVPKKINNNFSLNSEFCNYGKDIEIKSSIISYRNFISLICDKLIEDGESFFKLKSKPGNLNDYPFIYQLTDLLAEIGYYSEFTLDKTLKISQLPSFVPVNDINGNKIKTRNSISKLLELINFLDYCGVHFSGIELKSKSINFETIKSMTVNYPSDPMMLLGLKMMSIADIEIREKRYKNDFNHDNLLRCNYKLLSLQKSETIDDLADFIEPLTDGVKAFALALHEYCLGRGMICTPIISTFDTHFAYTYLKDKSKKYSPKQLFQKRLWEFSLSTKDGYSLIVRSKKTHKYAEVISNFPESLRDKILKGYGCNRKLHNEPCQNGCQGICFALDDTICNISDEIKIWFDNEVFK